MTRAENKTIRNLLRGWAARLDTTKTQDPRPLIRNIAREMREIARELETIASREGR